MRPYAPLFILALAVGCCEGSIAADVDAIRDFEGRVVGSDSDVVAKVSTPCLEPMLVD